VHKTRSTSGAISLQRPRLQRSRLRYVAQEVDVEVGRDSRRRPSKHKVQPAESVEHRSSLMEGWEEERLHAGAQKRSSR
jgi:hypothetical protein